MNTFMAASMVFAVLSGMAAGAWLNAVTVRHR